MDNYFHNCPAKMSDQGRQLADFRSPTAINEYIKHVNNLYRDDQYRLFLQLNGKEIMDREWKYYTTNSSCSPNDCIHNYPLRGTIDNYIKERQAYDSIFNPRTNAQMEPLRQCKPMTDFRMVSDQ